MQAINHLVFLGDNNSTGAHRLNHTPFSHLTTYSVLFGPVAHRGFLSSRTYFSIPVPLVLFGYLPRFSLSSKFLPLFLDAGIRVQLRLFASSEDPKQSPGSIKIPPEPAIDSASR